ncbi:MAG: sodium:solute symporter [Candidatus Marinimicrobia bacterium]|nr:sodium:solute symporter [Candidatus Neomarinimicrobiota bacterium]
MQVIDYVIVVVFILGIFTAGTWLGKSVKNVTGYYTAGKNLPWWAVMISIVAAETSVLTFLSIPGLAYISDLSFLQVCLGYIVGRFLVSFILLPMYVRGNFISVYESIHEKGGITMQRVMSITFMFTRLLADGVRLFAVAIPLAMITGFSYGVSIWIMGIVTIIYTWVGGIRSVVWMDVVQWIIYIIAAFFTLGIAYNALPDPGTIFSTMAEQGKFNLFTFNLDMSQYSIFSGLLGGGILSMASHGIDQLIVQRVLSCKSLADSKKAMIGSGFVVFFQFALFLCIGLLMYAVWGGATLAEKGLRTSDEIFTLFIINQLPPGIKGITVAGIFAAAMSSLSGSLSALSSTTTMDILKPILKIDINQDRFLKISRLVTLIWGIIMVGGASLFTNMDNPLVEVGLSISSFTYGAMLGMFILTRFFAKAKVWQYVVTFFTTLTAMTCIIQGTTIHWTWYTIIGLIISIVTEQILVRLFGTATE